MLSLAMTNMFTLSPKPSLMRRQVSANASGSNACLGQCGHEIGIADPARDDVDMNMFLHTCASRLADIDANVKDFVP